MTQTLMRGQSGELFTMDEIIEIEGPYIMNFFFRIRSDDSV